MHTPHKVTFYLELPTAVPNRALHLDGLLAFAAVHLAQKRGDLDPYLAQEELPLASEGTGLSKIWKASQLMFDRKSPTELVSFTRRYNIYATAARCGKNWNPVSSREPGARPTKIDRLEISTGHDKAYDMRLPVAWFSKATAWFVGDPDEVGKLLANITSLGKKRSQGWGRIQKIEIEADETANTNWALRALPTNLKNLATPNHILGTASLRPPYWDRKAWQEALELPAC